MNVNNTLARRSILVIDDDLAMLKLIKEVVSSAGAKVHTTQTSSSGVTQAKKLHPDVILLDRYLSNEDAHEILKKLTTDDDTKHIPVIMITGENKESEIKESIKLGAKGYVIKPFRPDNLLKSITAAANR